MTSIVDHDVLVGGVRLHYREAGPAMAPTVIALHATGLDGHSWDHITRRLARRWHVVAPDLRGHGRSQHGDEYSFESLRDEVAGFVAALGLTSAALVGHSMGGTVATLVAEGYPAMVERLVLEDTPPPRRLDPPPQFPTTPPARLRVPVDAWTALMGQLADPDPAWWRDLEVISAPTLIIGGGATSFVPQQELAMAADRIRDCRLVTIDGAGHQVHAERPEEFLAHLTGFLNGPVEPAVPDPAGM